MARLFIYHPGTGTAVFLADPVFLIDANDLTPDEVTEFIDGNASGVDAARKGIIIDNYNMGNLFGFNGEG